MNDKYKVTFQNEMTTNNDGKCCFIKKFFFLFYRKNIEK